MVHTAVSALKRDLFMTTFCAFAIASAAMKPALWRVPSYLKPGFPKNTTSQDTAPGFLNNIAFTSEPGKNQTLLPPSSNMVEMEVSS